MAAPVASSATTISTEALSRSLPLRDLGIRIMAAEFQRPAGSPGRARFL